MLLATWGHNGAAIVRTPRGSIACWYYQTQSGGKSRRVSLRTARRVIARYRALHRAERNYWRKLARLEHREDY
jgi:hypothetical protein